MIIKRIFFLIAILFCFINTYPQNEDGFQIARPEF